MSTRRVVLILAVVLILGVGGYVLNRMGYFARDSENGAEIAKLTDKKLELPPTAAADVGWPHWRGPTDDGRAPAGPFRTDWDKTPPKLLWRFDCGGGFSSCSVVGGKVFTQDLKDGNERVVCIDAVGEKPTELWAHPYPVNYSKIRGGYSGGPRATPTHHANRVYAVGALGKFLCLDAATGNKLWEHDLCEEFAAEIPQWGVACSPLIEGELVIVQPGGKNGSVVAFDRTSGEVRWKAGSNPAGYSSPVVAVVGGVRTVFAFVGDALLAIRVSDGKVTDSYEWKTQHHGNIATPLVVDGYVFISSAYSQGSALLRAEAKGDEVKFVQVYARRGRAFQNHHSSSVFRDRHLFGFDGMMGSARLKCVNFETGREKEDWDSLAVGTGSGTLILADKHLIIQTERGELCLVEATPEEFRLVAKMKVLSGNSNWATPTLVDGRLYLRDETKVVCYDVR